ncbi:hypothetical protein Y032_0300g1806 [Ancylostoma ceylanicum]|uniref:Uncharacterized protein n=1 Tax=Ancylostoma ceylanicum TaxID=53326 RepID=A0A016S3V4_9BILA|nr:hypothetical protein Y032_0300g1806 [Ancylostoma ceylanicum]
MLKRPPEVLRAAAVAFLLLLLDAVRSQLDGSASLYNGSAEGLPRPGRLPDEFPSTAHKNVTNGLLTTSVGMEAIPKIRRSAYGAPSTRTNVDKIQDVELGPTSIVITTTKQGPVESLKIRIELIDLHDNRTLPPIDLFGLFLVVARGRYTVPFLKPERWYGLMFTSENEVNGQVNVHKENRLVRTTSRQQNITTAEDLYEVLMHRNLDGEESAERLYVTSKWKGEERLPLGELHTNVKVHCESSSTTERMVLHHDEDSVTIEISMDLLYDIEELNDTLHQVVAHITPLRCHEICWQSSLMATSGLENFEEDAPRECHRVDGTNSTTFLRHMKEYTVKRHNDGYELVVETELQEKNEEGFVTLSAMNLGGDDGKPRSKTFSTKASNGTFRLPLLEDSIYAAQYQYTKMKPFHYTTREHFLVETGTVNSSRSSNPLIEAHFELDNHTVGEDETLHVPTVILARGAPYSDREVQLHMRPFCEEANSSTWDFGGNQTSRKIDLTVAVCSSNPQASFCNQTGSYPECSPMLCYSTSIAIEGADYPSTVRCVNVTEQFPSGSPEPSYLRTSALLLTVFYHFCSY